MFEAPAELPYKSVGPCGRRGELTKSSECECESRCESEGEHEYERCSVRARMLQMDERRGKEHATMGRRDAMLVLQNSRAHTFFYSAYR